MKLKESIVMNKRQDSAIPGKWCKMEENKYFGKCKVSLSGEGLYLNEAGAGLLYLISLVIFFIFSIFYIIWLYSCTATN